jgi:tetraacyldisaccharide 4'-kinase
MKLLLKLLLTPFSLIYMLVTDFRNHLYDIGKKPSVQFDRFVIAVGNLTVGGTGKTPFVEWIIRRFRHKHRLAVLSRGYGRKTSGFRLAGKEDDAFTIGDEPFQYLKKYGMDIRVTVGEDRAMAVPELLFRDEEIEVIVLDDAYQHRRVRPQLNILLSDHNRPFYQDTVLPAGRLREARKHARRADLVVVTKCPDDLTQKKMEHIEEKVGRYTAPKTPVFFAGIRYLKPERIYGNHAFSRNIYLFSGIANHKTLSAYVDQHFNLIHHKAFPDHYIYTGQDLRNLIISFEKAEKSDKVLLTTEKDMVRLLSMKEQLLSDYPVFYLPIELYFLKNEDFFAKKLETLIERGIGETGQGQ